LDRRQTSGIDWAREEKWGERSGENNA